MDWATFGTTVGASALGAGLTAVLGFRFALARFRRERGVEVRVEWYETAIKKLNASAHLLVAAATYQRTYKVSDPKVLGDPVTVLLEVNRLYAEGELYATQDSLEALGAASNMARDALVLLTPEHFDPNSARHGELLDLMASAAFGLQRTSTILAREIRKELGLKKIKTSWDRGEPSEEHQRWKHVREMLGNEGSQWQELPLALLERIVNRSDHMMRPDEALAIADGLERYAHAMRDAALEARDEDQQ